MRIKFIHTYQDIISVENFLESWREFTKGKKSRTDVQLFSFYLMNNIIDLHNDLLNFNYQHGPYQSFSINDPKPRNIHKALVRDRLLHHAIYRILYPFFDSVFASDSFSCGDRKGTHKALNRFRQFSCVVSKNNTKTCWVLKCDIRKFFENIDHQILIDILTRYIQDKDIMWLLNEVISSFHKGLSLGNLTSQLFVNIYMNEFDRWIKHHMKAKYYIRYADDFVILSQDKSWLQELTFKIGDFLSERLKLELHPNKVYIKTFASGVDFLGWVHFPKHRVLRTATKKRMFKKIKINPKKEAVASYLGLLKHGNGYKLRKSVIK